MSAVDKWQTGLVRSREDLKRVWPVFRPARLISFDFETASLTDPTVWGFGLAIPPSADYPNGYAIYFGCEDDCDLDFERDLQPLLEEKFADPQIEVVGHNLKFDTKVARKLHLRAIPSRICDTMILSHMIANDEKRHALDVCSLRYVKHKMEKGLMEIREYRDTDKKLYWSEMLRYGTEDVIVPLLIRRKLLPIFEKEGLIEQARDLEMRMVGVTTEMELNGFMLDTDHLSALEIEYANRIEKVEKAVYAHIGYEFNVNSPVQLSEALFDPIKRETKKILPLTGKEVIETFERPALMATLPDHKRGKPRGKKNPKPGAWSTADSILQSLNHPVCDELRRYRHDKKILGTYIKPMLIGALADPRSRYYVEWKQTGAQTGRYCVSERVHLETSEGYRTIPALDVDKLPVYVYTHKSRLRRVLRKIYKGREELFRVRLANGAVIECTRNHRFLTKRGWVRLQDIGDGRVFTYRFGALAEIEKSNRKAVDFGRAAFRGALVQAGYYAGEGEGVRNQSSCSRAFNQNLQKQISERTQGSQTEALCSIYEGECEGLSGGCFARRCAAGCRAFGGRIGGVVVGWGAVRRDRRSFWGVGLHGAEKYYGNRFTQIARRFALSVEAFGSIIFGVVGAVDAWTCGCGAQLLRRSEKLLRTFVRGVLSRQPSFMVLAGSSQGIFLLAGDATNTEVAHYVGIESARAFTFNSSRGCGDSAHSAVPILWSLDGGFLYPGVKSIDRSGRGISSRVRGSKARKENAGSRVQPFAIQHDRGAAECGDGDRGYTLARIVSVKSIGIGDVWDIEVEGDHSYLAEGFVNHNSSSPNAQNFPREKGLIRKAVIAEPGFVFGTCDYSQIELRFMAHFSGDPELQRAYMNNEDVHKRTAAAISGVLLENVTKEQRQAAKAVNFGLLYGMSAKRLQATARFDYGVDEPLQYWEAAKDAYFRLYRGVKDYHNYMRDYVYTHGYAENIIGERRYLRNYNLSDKADPEAGYKRWQAWSQGVNYTIQGSTAALIKIAMLNIYDELIRPHGFKVSKKYGRVLTLWRSNNNLAHEVRMVMQVHDEIVFEVREEIAEPFMKWVRYMMETAITGVSVPVIAEYEPPHRILENAK